jgi:hypothetical protein
MQLTSGASSLSLQMSASSRSRSRLIAALVAGSIAIILNTLALKAADLVPLATARGGLLRLIKPWLSLVAPVPNSAEFQTGFHLFVGILMALFYAYALEPWLPRGAWLKGFLYALAVWLLNAIVVLPATGEGFAGSAHLTLPGMIWFAVAHTLFFVLLAIGYEWLMRRTPS